MTSRNPWHAAAAHWHSYFDAIVVGNGFCSCRNYYYAYVERFVLQVFSATTYEISFLPLSISERSLEPVHTKPARNSGPARILFSSLDCFCKLLSEKFVNVLNSPCSQCSVPHIHMHTKQKLTMMYNETEPVIEEILNQIAQTASNINLSSTVTGLIQELISDTGCTNYHLQICCQ